MKILLGMSGGVDSTFAALKLMREGYCVEGAVLKMHEHTELSAARAAAENLGITLHEIDCTEDFDNIIKSNFVAEYTKGRTPNPCIICNEKIKFRYLCDYAQAHGFDRVATGHYASVVTLTDGGDIRYAVSRAEDLRKDQTYMLYRLPQDILAMLVLPLSSGTKDSVRQEAKNAGLISADRKDSQEICFLPDGGHAEFVESRAGKSPEGDFVDENGNVLGRHKGIVRYTVGQRKGLGISLGERAFVTDIDPVNNTVTLSGVMKGRDTVSISDIVFSGMKPPSEAVCTVLDVKLRYTAAPITARVTVRPDRTATLEFDEAVKAAPGQSAVLYKNGVVMLGGFID